MNKRIEYIDALRGFTMLLVVFSHIEYFSFGIESSDNVISSMFVSFRMPLFFFISGFLAYKYEICRGGGKLLMSCIFKKVKIQIIPTLTFGLAFTYINHKNFIDFISHESKLGYWFTLVLLQMFIMYYLICYITHKYSIKENFKPLFIILITFAICLQFATIPIRRIPEIFKFCQITSFINTCEYFIYFVFGIIASKYRYEFIRHLQNDIYSAIYISIFIILNYIHFLKIEPSSLIFLLLQKATPIILGFSGIITVFNFFRTYKDSFTKETRIGKWLQYIGKRTLDIYLLHYFLLPTMPVVGTYLKEYPNTVIELLCGLTLAIIVTVLCLIISNILRTSMFLGHYLFGAKKQQLS